MRKHVILASALMLLGAAPAFAKRTAIDQFPDGTPLYYTLSGYCDFDGDECQPGGGVTLPYQFQIGAAPATDRIWIHGNGILGLGGSADFTNPGLGDIIFYGGTPDPTQYGFNLISAGQNNQLDRGAYYQWVFFQSANLKVRGNGSIVATWFTCYVPSSPTSCPADNVYRLTLRPTRDGFLGSFDFSQGGPYDDTRIGYVIDDGEAPRFTPTGNSFLLPAVFTGNVSFVPEPDSWAMLIAGFGLSGAALRRRRALAAA